MSLRMYFRCGAALCVAALTAACSSSPGTSSRLFNECTWNRSACMYEGSYEPDEEAYAEEEARRLNKSQSIRLRSN
ncbi:MULTISPECIES: hypothetical protein [Bordetella]|uniref:hypothetical protein n=1 Tax=Bordetella TaxID=517 RepID=UPI001482095B|nr:MULTISPECIES: hypothetical protein [Bordetella]